MSRSLLAALAALALVLAGGFTCWGGQGVPGPARPTTANDLFLAARTGDLEAVRAAVAAGANVDEVLCYWGVDSGREQETPLFAAAAAGHTEVVRYLLEAGADPDIRCLEDGTALTIAPARDRVDVLRLLLDADADVLGPR